MRCCERPADAHPITSRPVGSAVCATASRDGRTSDGAAGQEIAASATIPEGPGLVVLRRDWPGVRTRLRTAGRRTIVRVEL
jgi:hypothetical protein